MQGARKFVGDGSSRRHGSESTTGLIDWLQREGDVTKEEVGGWG